MICRIIVCKNCSDEAVIIQVMLTHSEHAGVQQQACEALRSLANNSLKRSKIAGASRLL
jgi:hypothetical protein